MQTLQFQVQDTTYQDILDKGIDIQSQVKAFISDLVDDGYPSIATKEAKQRVNESVNQYRNDNMKTISHKDMWNNIDLDCKVKSADTL